VLNNGQSVQTLLCCFPMVALLWLPCAAYSCLVLPSWDGWPHLQGMVGAIASGPDRGPSTISGILPASLYTKVMKGGKGDHITEARQIRLH
jgi:hypothetical protein